MNLHSPQLNRRSFLATSAAACGASLLFDSRNLFAASDKFKLNYILNSAMYGYTDLSEILPEVRKTGTNFIDIWPKVHGNQREQAAEMGTDRFKELLAEHQVKLGVVTCYKQGPFKLESEMKFAHEVSGPGVVLVTGARGPKGLQGKELKKALAEFIEKMKPHVDLAEKYGCQIAVENHAHSLLQSPDSLRWFGELAKSDRLGVALAPHHLPQDGDLIGGIADQLGPKTIFFYAQQHGMGSSKKLPKEQEMLQMPGLGSLDFTPIIAALKKHNYQGFTEIFMHPVPRGVPILETTSAITSAINDSRDYLEKCLASLG